MIALTHHIDYTDFTPINRELCRSCGSECCDKTTPFTPADIKAIKKSHRKLLRGVKMIPAFSDAVILEKQNNQKCVFLDKNKLCSIYDIRPQICRDFGDKPYCLCAYNGLDEIPTDPKQIAFLASEAQRKNTERLAAGLGVRVKADMIDPSMENVLSDKQRRKTLDFRKES